MGKSKKKQIAGALSRIVFMRFFMALILYSIILAVLFLVGIYIGVNQIWYPGLVYEFLHLLFDMKYIVGFVIWLLGAFIIFLYYWKKTLGYIDTMVEASNQLVSIDEGLIYLPSELKQVEEQMNQIKQEALRNARLAKEAEQRKNDLVVYLAHDLKTPLTSVIGYLTLLHDELQISEELREKYLSVSLNKAERLEELINEFFEITRFNLSNLTLELGRVNLSRMLEQIVYEFNPIFATKNLQPALQIAANVEIKCDVNKMERVFDNMIRNAINYSFEDSVIDIIVMQEETGIRMKFKNAGNTIPKEKLGRIFEEFYRLDSSRTSKTGGAGLGLAIAKQIIELHQGTIKAFSENETVTFEIWLPYSS